MKTLETTMRYFEGRRLLYELGQEYLGWFLAPSAVPGGYKIYIFDPWAEQITALEEASATIAEAIASGREWVDEMLDDLAEADRGF